MCKSGVFGVSEEISMRGVRYIPQWLRYYFVFQQVGL
nr:MAG TPA: Transcription factor Opi1 [Caudoviricetes sp.]